LIVRVPAEDHIAEAEALLERSFELVAGHVLAPHDAIRVGQADLHEGQVAAAHILHGIGSVLDCWSGHARKSQREGWRERTFARSRSAFNRTCTRPRPW